MKNSSQFRNQNGAFAVSLVFITGIIAAVGIWVYISKSQYMNTAKIKYLAIYDAEMAVDLFARSLRDSYEMGSPIAESNLAKFADTVAGGYLVSSSSPAYKLPFTVYPSVGVGVTTNIPIQFFIPTGGGLGPQICVQRSAALGLIAGASICINMPGDLVTLYDYPPDYEPQLPQAGDKHPFIKFLTTAKKAFAQSSDNDASDPGPVANVPVASVGTMTVAAADYDPSDPAFIMRYANNNCSLLQTDRFCVTIKFCIKIGQACLPEEEIQQTYVFLRVPETSLAN
ncbi:MAG: hypothetical protein V4736_10280 [Bdellovibrionota bacterium]